MWILCARETRVPGTVYLPRLVCN